MAHSAFPNSLISGDGGGLGGDGFAGEFGELVGGDGELLARAWRLRRLPKSLARLYIGAPRARVGCDLASGVGTHISLGLNSHWGWRRGLSTTKVPEGPRRSLAGQSEGSGSPLGALRLVRVLGLPRPDGARGLVAAYGKIHRRSAGRLPQSKEQELLYGRASARANRDSVSIATAHDNLSGSQFLAQR
jgi:hypothetical protein